MRFWLLSVLFVAFLGTSLSASAQQGCQPLSTPGAPNAPCTPIVGFGLLGADLAISVSSALGVRKAPILFAITSVGLAGGIVGGVLIDRRIQGQIAHDTLGVSSMILGMGGIIPSVLIVLQTRSNDASKPPKEEKKKKGEKKEGEEETEALLLPPGLLNLSDGQVRLSAPSIISMQGQGKDLPMGALLFSGSF